MHDIDENIDNSITMCISLHLNTHSHSTLRLHTVQFPITVRFSKLLRRNLLHIALFSVTFASQLWVLPAEMRPEMVWELYGLVEGLDCKAVVVSHSDCPQNLHSTNKFMKMIIRCHTSSEVIHTLWVNNFVHKWNFYCQRFL